MGHGYSSESTQRELSKEYQRDSVKMLLIVYVRVLWTKEAIALEWLEGINQFRLNVKGYTFILNSMHIY